MILESLHLYMRIASGLKPTEIIMIKSHKLFYDARTREAI